MSVANDHAEMQTAAQTGLAPRGKRFKMRLLAPTFMVNVSGNQGRYQEGDVLLVDEDTAYRWFENRVADLADPDAPTVGEMRMEAKREEFDRRARAVEGTLDGVIARRSSSQQGERGLMPPPMPVPSRGRRKANPLLEGAGVINDVEEDED